MSLIFSLAPFVTVGKVIESWRPKGCKTEKDFEQSLLKKLQKELPEQKVEPQYGSGRQRVDIVVNGKVPVEIKKDLESTSALQKTIGQLEEYLRVWDRLFLVLCGSVSTNLLKSLQKYAGQKMMMFDERVMIIVKGRKC